MFVAGSPGWDSTLSGPVPVRLGTGDGPSAIELSGDEFGDDPAVNALRAEADRVTRAPLLADAADGIGIVGPAVLAAATARALAVQVAARLTPGGTSLSAPVGETWTVGLPHRVIAHGESEFRWARDDATPVIIAWAARGEHLPLGCRTVLEAGSRWHAITAREAAETAAVLTERAGALGHLPATRASQTTLPSPTSSTNSAANSATNSAANSATNSSRMRPRDPDCPPHRAGC